MIWIDCCPQTRKLRVFIITLNKLGYVASALGKILYNTIWNCEGVKWSNNLSARKLSFRYPALDDNSNTCQSEVGGINTSCKNDTTQSCQIEYRLILSVFFFLCSQNMCLDIAPCICNLSISKTQQHIREYIERLSQRQKKWSFHFDKILVLPNLVSMLNFQSLCH